jgi:predicted phage replisome organizer
MFDNRKIKHLRKLPDGNNIVLIWVMLLTMAGRCNAGGMIFLTENIPYTPKMLADELDFEENTVVLALQALEQLDMIVTDNGYFTIAGWEEYQNADKLADMKAKDRERKRLKRAQAKALPDVSTDVRGMSTECPRNVHGMSTECPHIEEEIEEEEEKEIHSFILSRAREEESEFSTDVSSMRKRLGGKLGAGVVFLSDDQISHLLDILTVDEFDHYVGIVRDQELKGHHYTGKTHYQAILDMANKDRRT